MQKQISDNLIKYYDLDKKKHQSSSFLLKGETSGLQLNQEEGSVTYLK